MPPHPIMRLRLIAAALACGASLSFLPSIAAREPAPAPGELDIRRDAVVEAIERVLPSVVNIVVQRRDSEGGGSGVIVDEEGYVLTNAHVVGEGATRIWIKVNGETEAIAAERMELTRAKDVALLKLKGKPGRRYKAIRFAREDDLLLGETVIALGNPFGLDGSVSRGILSSKNRRRPEEVPAGKYLDIADWLQTDAAINPGNSGGPLINLRGEMIGLNVAILSPQLGAQGIGFAIPIKHVSIALAEILTGDSLRGFWFGARLKASQVPLTVQAVQSGSPAEKAGLQAEDVLVSINGQRPSTLIDFTRILVEAGDRKDVRMIVSRAGKQRELVLRMIQESDFFNADLVRRRTGLSVTGLTPEQAERLRLRGGLVVTGVDRNSPAAAAELEPGMIVVSLNGDVVTSIVDAAKDLHGRKRGEQATLGVVVTEQRGFFARRYLAEAAVKLR